MKLVEMTVSQYLDTVSSDAPAPGGGSASAFCGAQGAGLAAMVAGLTLGKKKYENDQELCAKIVPEAQALAKKLEVQIDLDTDAFGGISAAMKLPKETEEEKAARRQAIAAATLVATQVPFETLSLALEGAKLARQLVGHSNTNAASDLGVAALNLESCARGAWYNVRINLSGISDEAVAREFSERAQKMLEETQAICGEIAHAVTQRL